MNNLEKAAGVTFGRTIIRVLFLHCDFLTSSIWVGSL